MFGSNPFGQSTSSPFGSQPGFGQTNNATSNPFAPKPFGSTSPFSSQTGSSIFGGMSTGVFGAPASSPLGSSSLFGASSSPALGGSTPTFGAQSGSAFGNGSSTSGGSTVFGQKQTFGGFGSSTTQTSPFGGSFQQSQPAFGSSMFGSSNFGAPSQPSFGSMTTPAFGASTTPSFGASSTPAFGSTAIPVFGSTSSGFGLSSSPFGSTTPAFGSNSTPAFGATTTPAFGSSPAFGSTSTPGFGSTSTPTFGSTGVLGFGAPSTSSFNIGSSPAFGQSTSAFGGNPSPFGTASAFGAQSTPFGSQTTSPPFGSTGFGQSQFGVQRGGSRVTPYSPVPETDGATGTQPAGKLLSISAMPVYKEKSHEELRWEDYQLGDKGGPSPVSQAATGAGFGSLGFGSSTTAAFGQSSANPFSSSTSSNPFAPKTPIFSNSGFGSSSTSAFASSPFGTSNTSNVFGSTASAATSFFGPTTTSSLFSSSSASGFGSPSIFGSSSVPGPTSAFGTALSFGNTQSSPLSQSTTPSLLQTNPMFGQTSAFSQPATGFGQSNYFGAPSTGFGGGLFSSTSSLLSSNTLGFGQVSAPLTTQFQSAQPSQSSGGFNFSNFGQSQSAGAGVFGGTPGIFSNAQQSINAQGPLVAQPVPITNPFGTLPAMPQMSIGRSGLSPSIQYGISNLPVVDKPSPVRISSLLTSRHFSQRRFRLPVRKYNPKTEGPKVAFFNDDEEMPSTPKADAFFLPRENPRALVIRPIDLWPPRSSADKTKAVGPSEFENGKSLPHDHKTKGKDAVVEDNDQATEQFISPNGKQKTDKGHTHSHVPLNGTQTGSQAVNDIKAVLPKLQHTDYYMQPGIQELAAKERGEPGFCSHVKDFIVGRNGCGSIKFFGETDIRGVDLDSIVQFNDREVIVYMDDSKKPPVGQGLNKPAEITLLNIKCIDKKTGQSYTEGPRIDKYKALLKKKAEDQGAEFVSFDPVKGEWKFRVTHFSFYSFQDDYCDCEDVLSS